MQLNFLTRNDTESNTTFHQASFSFWLLEFTRNCEYKTPEFSFSLKYCNSYQIGSRLTVIGSLTPNSDKHFFGPKGLTVHAVRHSAFSKYSVNYWLEHGMNWCIQLRSRLLKELKDSLPEPAAGLVSGMVFGGSQQLSEQLAADLKTTGLTHVVSASGYNVSMVVAVGMLVCKRLPKLLGTIAAVILVVMYTTMANAVAPVMRAAVMSVLSIGATRVWMRQYDPAYSLLLVTMGLLIWQPWYLKSLSFWLSVTATAGIVLILPLLEKSPGWLAKLTMGESVPTSSSEGKKASPPVITELREAFLTTLAAQSFTAPLVLLVFGQLSVLSILTNTVLLWLTPVLTLGGLGYMMIGMILRMLPIAHQIWTAVATPLLLLPARLFLEAVEFFGQWTWGVLNYQLPIAALLGWWLVVAIICKWPRTVARLSV